MSQVEDFLTAEEEKEIINSILKAERKTSGEIRVHIEPTTSLNHFKRAEEVFALLKMENTRDRNGVLIYVAVRDRKFVIIGDKGINEVVPEGFWDSTKEIIQHEFKKGEYKKGIIEGVLRAGRELKGHFPWKPDDTNELSNEISKG
ncbi:TPM domain-containing protein [Eudoraea chungangensis]|uniref:TPM domain-containing protein n=1 Tax=Eudoraea chungangensis TaxID=1481905 RepID=UPI0023ED5CF8|nr:TPM domain-containing protein [Eudoraea chungangensis]